MSDKVVEAMACARAVVATDVGDIGPLLGNGRGLLVPPNAPDAFVAALGRAARDPALRATLGAAARARIRDHHRGDELIRRYAATCARARRGRSFRHRLRTPVGPVAFARASAVGDEARTIR